MPKRARNEDTKALMGKKKLTPVPRAEGNQSISSRFGVSVSTTAILLL